MYQLCHHQIKFSSSLNPTKTPLVKDFILNGNQVLYIFVLLNIEYELRR